MGNIWEEFDDNIDTDALQKDVEAVSYTHLDVYKRQEECC